ncbi:MAG: sulfate ABC transporter permease subunit [Anaerolineae bacterium]|nr:sulfate ABC transporter permease subunit [Gemmatimonadaceae bacterium]
MTSVALHAADGVVLAGRSPAPRSSWTLARAALLAVVIAYLGIVLLMPLAALVAKGIATGPLRIARELAAPEALFAFGQSLILAAIAVVLNGAFGVAGAIVLVRHRFVGRKILDAIVDLSLAISPVMTGLAFLLVFGRSGWLAPLGIKVAFALPGLVLCTLFVTLPYTLREVGYVLEEIGTDDEEAAATLGASAWQSFWRVTLPNVRYGLAVGLTLTAARALGEFGAVLVVGGAISGRTQTATTFIYAMSEERREAAAFGMAIALAVASMLLLAAVEKLKHRKGDR